MAVLDCDDGSPGFVVCHLSSVVYYRGFSTLLYGFRTQFPWLESVELGPLITNQGILISFVNVVESLRASNVNTKWRRTLSLLPLDLARPVLPSGNSVLADGTSDSTGSPAFFTEAEGFVGWEKEVGCEGVFVFVFHWIFSDAVFY